MPRHQDFAFAIKLSNVVADYQQDEAMLRNKLNPMFGQYLGLQVQRVKITGRRFVRQMAPLWTLWLRRRWRWSDVPLDLSAGGAENLAQCR